MAGFSRGTRKRLATLNRAIETTGILSETEKSDRSDRSGPIGRTPGRAAADFVAGIGGPTPLPRPRQQERFPEVVEQRAGRRLPVLCHLRHPRLQVGQQLRRGARGTRAAVASRTDGSGSASIPITVPFSSLCWEPCSSARCTSMTRVRVRWGCRAMTCAGSQRGSRAIRSSARHNAGPSAAGCAVSPDRLRHGTDRLPE